MLITVRAGLMALLALSSMQVANAGIINLNYAENRSGFVLHVDGDAIDSDTSARLAFGSNWQIDLSIQEVDDSNDQLVISGTATHLVPTAGEEFDFSISVLGSDRGFPLLGIGFPPHNAAGILGFGPFDFFSVGLSYASTSQLGMPPPGTLPDQITEWSFSLSGTHISEPETLPILLGALLGLWYQQRQPGGRNRPSRTRG